MDNAAQSDRKLYHLKEKLVICRWPNLYSLEVAELSENSRKELWETIPLAKRADGITMQQEHRTTASFNAYPNGRTAFLIVCIALFGMGEVFVLYLVTP